MPTLRQQERSLSSEVQPLAVWQQARPTPVHLQNRNHLRRLSARSGQVAVAMWMVVNCKNGVSSYEIHRAIGITQKSAWFMDHRIRLALGMAPKHDKLLAKWKRTRPSSAARRGICTRKRKRRITGTGGKDKTAVMGILERGGKVRTTSSRTARRKRFRRKSRSTSRPVPRSTPIRCFPTRLG